MVELNYGMKNSIEMAINAADTKPKRKRGRPRKIDERWIEARGISAASAAEILAWRDERRQWARVFNSTDDNIVLRALIYLTDKRDGKAAQTLNVTSRSINISARDIDMAREIARAMMGATMIETAMIEKSAPDLSLPESTSQPHVAEQAKE